MADELNCTFCNSHSGESVHIFSEEIFKKCKTILRLRKFHNLKYSDVSLPREHLDSGYHRKCYKSFTALKKIYYDTTTLKKKQTSPPPSQPQPSTSTDVENIIEDGQELDQSTEDVVSNTSETISLSLDISTEDDTIIIDNSNVCFFCDKNKKKHRSKQQVLHRTQKSKFQFTIGANLNLDKEYEKEIFNKLTKWSSDTLYYHHICHTEFCNKLKVSNKKTVETGWHIRRNLHQNAFDEICLLIEDNVINRGRCYLLSYLHRLYVDILKNSDDENQEMLNITFTAQHLEEKMKIKFNNDIRILQSNHKKVVAPRGITIVDDDLLANLKDEDTLQAAALILRREILNIKKKKLPENLTVTNLLEGECSTPQILTEFVGSIIGSDNCKRRKSNNYQRHVNSLSQDLIFMVHNGNIKTSKHICLGMALKSLTSSRKVVDVLNRYGHCISYNTIEELETEATYTSVSRSGLCPEVVKKSGNLCTGVAYDNFDRFVDTASGKDTLHDTVGIIYQNIDLNVEDIAESSEIEVDNDSRKRRRRTFDAISSELPAYTKKPRMICAFHSAIDDREKSCPENIKLYSQIDAVWMLCHALRLPDIPMWTGFNSKIINDDNPQQLISYLTPINASPTNASVVLETMLQSIKIADELNQNYMQVTYDLAIAKVALQIQATEKPTFDRLFIHLGPFHIMLAYFKAIGKIINDCGLSTIITEGQLLASGSVNSFIEGKHFNRCKRLHPIMALGLRVLHFRSFLQAQNIEVSEDILSELSRLQSCSTSSFTIEDEQLMELYENYAKYEEKTMNGEFGKTGQFYMMYINFVNYYLTLSRSIRLGDFELFKYILPKITNLFFACNQPNYARWTVKYHYNLTKVAETHPGLEEDLKKGCFGIKRTEKSFSKQPIDLTLEQTINADAGRRLTGVVHFTNSISARQRWARSHDIRSTIISHVFEELGFTKQDDISGDLKPHNIKKNCQQLQTFIDSFDRYINPFSAELSSDQLFNISTGKAASPLVQQFLLNVENIGNEQREHFISECIIDISRFERSIKKTPFHNFSKELEKKKSVKIGGKVQEIRLQRDLFGRMLGISMDHNVDVMKILSYPITPVPLSLCHLDGAICKTNKSVLAKCLQTDINHESPRYTDVFVIDGFFLLHTMKEIPKTFGNISKKTLQMLTKLPARRIDVIFDQYFHPSIKDNERSLRHESQHAEFIISGPDQTRPADFAKEMKNIKFKEALIDFFCLHWACDENAPFFSNKTVHLNFRRCYSYVGNGNKVESKIVEDLCCELHEEADSKIIYHACSISDKSNIVIKASDTDVLVMMLGNMNKLKNTSSHVWMQLGIGNNERIIDVTRIHEHLGELTCRSLLGFHAFTGCDYNPSFYNKGKKRPFSLLKKNPTYQEAFAALGDHNLTENRMNEIFHIIQNFTCEMYNLKRCIDVNDARFQLFVDTYKATDINEQFNIKVRNFDGSSLPPCKSELWQHFLRTIFICNIWNNADKRCPSTLQPEEYGWINYQEAYLFKWFDGDQLPGFVADSVQCPSECSISDDEADENIQNLEDVQCCIEACSSDEEQ